jgi:hypothetical protein
LTLNKIEYFSKVSLGILRLNSQLHFPQSKKSGITAKKGMNYNRDKDSMFSLIDSASLVEGVL